MRQSDRSGSFFSKLKTFIKAHPAQLFLALLFAVLSAATLAVCLPELIGRISYEGQEIGNGDTYLYYTCLLYTSLLEGGKKPTTVGDLTDDESAGKLLNDIQLGSVLGISPLDKYDEDAENDPDPLMLALAYGEEGKMCIRDRPFATRCPPAYPHGACPQEPPFE